MKKIFLNSLIGIGLLSFAINPSLVLAENGSTSGDVPTKVTSGPSGGTTNSGGFSLEEARSTASDAGLSETEDLTTIIVNVLKWLSGILGFVFLIVVVIAGFMFILSGGEELAEKAREILMYAIIGLIVSLLAWVILNVIASKVLGINSSSSDGTNSTNSPLWSTSDNSSTNNSGGSQGTYSSDTPSNNSSGNEGQSRRDQILGDGGRGKAGDGTYGR